MKRKLETIFLILIILLSVLTIKVPANAFEDSQATGITQEELKNKQYLVTEDYIARISPKTEVGLFVMQFELKDKEIAIFKDKNKDVEIKEGLITTGMIMTVKDLVVTDEAVKEKDYELSVWGDINQDGYANILEVVNVINHIVGVEGEELTGIKFISSDLNGDGKVNIVDLNKLIRYIVFQELEIGETKQIEAPSIEIEETETNGWYNKDIKAIIKTNEENFKKTIYSINGKMIETTNVEEEILITEEGTYKIQAFTTSSNNSESNVVQKEIKIDKQAPVIESIKKSTEEETQEPVTIEIKASDSLSGLDDEAYSFDGGLSWQKENYKEYKENQEKIEIRIRDSAGNIKSEITNIQNITKVERREFEVVFKNYNGDILQTTKVEKGSIPSYEGKTPKKILPGYSCRFAGWDKEIQLVTNDIEYIATFTDRIIQYSIIYELNGGTLDLENPSSYNVETETFTLKNPQKVDYTFVGWSLNEDETLNEEVIIEKGSTGNRKYVANWEETVYVAKNEAKNKEYATINLAIEDADEGQIITLLENTKREVKVPNGKKIILDLNGKTIITSNTDKATLINNGELTIIDNGTKQGKIKNSKGKAIVNEANALLNIGILDNEIKLIPCIEGKIVGLENNGTFNYYDGTIIGNKSIIGNINSMPEGYNLLIGQNTGGTKQEAKIGLLTEAEAKIGEIYYLTLGTAIKSVNDGNKENPEQETITILKDIQVSSQIDIKSKANIKLDLNNKQIINSLNNGMGMNSFYVDVLINNMGKLEITDLSEEKGGTISTTSSNSLINNATSGEIVISGGKLSYNNTSTSSYKKAINNQGTLNIVDGEIYSTSSYVYLINNDGELKVSGGTIKLESLSYSYSSICINNNNKAEVTDGKLINTQSSGIILKNYGDVTIGTDIKNYETIDLDMQAYTVIDNQNDGTVTLTNLELELDRSTSIIHNGKNIKIVKSRIAFKETGIQNKSGELEIIESHISATQRGIYNENGTVVIKDSSVESTSQEGIYNDYGTVVIENSKVKSLGDYYNDKAVYNVEGNITVKSGEIVSKYYGIYNSRGTVDVGINDGKIYPTKYPNKNTEEKYPIIKGDQYAIYNSNGVLNYYDGILLGTKGLDQIIYGAINSTADNLDENNESTGKYIVLYDILETTVEYYAMLEMQPICKVLDENGKPIKDENRKEILYYSLKDAFDNCQNGYTIQILAEVNYDKTIEIPEKLSIKLDLNGNKITCSNDEVFVINNGILEIFDSEETENSIITSIVSKCVIENNGTLKISGVTISNQKSGTAESYNSVIRNNNGELIIEDGKVTSTGSYTYTIDNKAELKILQGIIEGNNSISNCSNVTIGGFTEEYRKIQITGEIVNNENGELLVNEGIINSINNKDNGTIVIKDKRDITQINSINNNGEGTINVQDGKIVTINNNGQGKINIQGGTIESINNKENGAIEIIEGKITEMVKNFKNGTIEIKGGTVEIVNNESDGAVTITDGTLNRGIYSIGTGGTINIVGGTIKGSASNGIYNNGKATINITGGIITGKTDGIYNLNGGIINLLGGKVIGNETGIYNINAILNIGIDDEELYPELDANAEDKYPVIKGVEYGIYNEGTFNYYDGIIYVDKTSGNAICGSIEDKANKYNENNEKIGKYDVVFKDTEEKHYAILGEMPVCKLLNSNNEVVIDGDGNEILYYNFEEAIKASLEDYTIQIIRIINYSDKIEITEGKKVKLDLNGFTITSSNKECLINNSGTLDILDSSDLKTGKIMSINCKNVVENNGTMKIKSGIIYNQNNGSQDNYNYVIKNKSGNLIVEGGTITTGENHYYMQTIENYGDLIVKSGTIVGYNSIQNHGTATVNLGQIDETLEIGEVGNIINNSDGVITLNKGNVNYKSSIRFDNNDNGKMTINDISIDGSVYNYSNNELTLNRVNVNTITNSKKGIVNIKGGKVEYWNDCITNSEEGTFNIEGTTIISGDTGISNNGLGTINIKDGTINSSYYGIYNDEEGIVNIKNTNIVAEGTGIYNRQGGEINIVESKISSIETSSSYYNYNSGIYNNLGTVNIGEKDLEDPKNITEIKSLSKYGVYNNKGTINFYDGTIIGKTGAVYGEINEIPEEYAIKSEIKTIELVEGLEIYKLEKIEDILAESDVNIGIIYYNNLQNAINACTNSEDVIILQRDIMLAEIVTIKNEQTIKIDLNGFAIEGSIENNGTLNITDSKGTVEEGKYGIITGVGTTNIQ